uniref:Uncharacterized protein n=1 Tax=Nothobranchius pienaari TaxID=704102 RepID=A0A1A8PAA9_9TELE
MRRYLQVKQQNQNNSSLEIRVSPQIVLRDDQEDYRKLKWELGWMRQWLKDTKSDENILMKRLFEMQCLANSKKHTSEITMLLFSTKGLLAQGGFSFTAAGCLVQLVRSGFTLISLSQICTSSSEWESCTCSLATSCFSLKLSYFCVSSGFRASFVSERQQSATFISTRVEVCIAVTSESISSLQSCAEL